VTTGVRVRRQSAPKLHFDKFRLLNNHRTLSWLIADDWAYATAQGVGSLWLHKTVRVSSGPGDRARANALGTWSR